MNERERLIELIHNAELAYMAKGIEIIENAMNEDFVEKIISRQEFFADHLLANGVVVPPCKVGDTVYSFCDIFGAILPYVVQNFGVGFLGKDRPNYWFWEATSHATETDELLDEIDFDLDDFGKTVFLSREEAEKALKERSEGE